jgi:hypothetical protein
MEVVGSRVEVAGSEVADSTAELVSSCKADILDQYNYLRYKIKLSEYD